MFERLEVMQCNPTSLRGSCCQIIRASMASCSELAFGSLPIPKQLQCMVSRESIADNIYQQCCDFQEDGNKNNGAT